jgi:anti-sigma-K factor RskA
LEPAPADATYQVWLVNDGGFTSLGTFEPEPDGSMEMRGDGIDPTGSTIGITVEPVGGSDQPTSPPVAESIV